MKISELILALEALKEKHGDCKAFTTETYYAEIHKAEYLEDGQKNGACTFHGENGVYLE